MTEQQKAFIPSPQQQAFFDWCANGTGSCNLTSVAGSGKEQPLYCSVQTPTGPVRMGDVKLGDTVLTPTGTAKVAGIFPQGVKRAFRVTFRDGASTECGIDHLWTVSRLNSGWRTLSLKEIVNDGLTNSAGNYKWKIPLSVAEYPAADLPLHPYLLGYLLGNGNFTGNTTQVSCHADDVEQIREILDGFLPHATCLGDARATSSEGVQFSIIKTERYATSERTLRSILIDDLKIDPFSKSIPEKYFVTSAQDRIWLLQGLMDSDGCCSRNRTTFSSSTPALIESVIRLVQSLGGTAIRFHNSTTDERRVNERALNIKVFDFNPFFLKRKADRWAPSTKNPPSRYIVNVEAVHDTEQQCIKLDDGIGLYFTDNFIVTHNTTTILHAVDLIAGECAILAFNKKIAEEISSKLKARGVDWKKAQAGTVHSFGFRAYTKRFPKVKVDNFKVANLVDKYYEVNGFDETVAVKGDIIKLVGFAKQRAIGIVERLDDESAYRDLIEHHDLFEVDSPKDDPEYADRVTSKAIVVAIKVLRTNNQLTSVIDFEDMIYLTLVQNVRLWQVDNVFVDEAQDQNGSRRAFVRALVKKGGRVIAVGDKFQAINGWAGADNDSLDQTARDFNSIEMNLTVTYRCPKAVVAFARQWVNHIEAHSSAIEGSVSSIAYEDIFARQDLNGSSAVLCRVTAPLVTLAFALVRKRIACKIEGRDIGVGLVKLATRWKRVKTLAALTTRLDDYFDKERTKFLAKKQEAKVQALEDRIATLKAIADGCQAEGKHDVADLVAVIENIFADNVSGILTLSTIHRSKGREFKSVFWLDRRGTCPSRWARQAWAQEQERNLCYVASTRAQENLIEVIVAPKKPEA